MYLGIPKLFISFPISTGFNNWKPTLADIDEEGNFVTGVTPYENNYWAFSRILEWIAWMKKNDVYDNTRIIILSDHGIRKLKIEDALIFNPFTSMETGKVNINSLFAFTPLMMMKDYGAKNTFKEDSRFLATADMLSMALNEDDPFADIPKNPRTLRAYYLHWKINYKSKKFPTERVYEVKDNIYDVNNWKLIETHKFD